MSPLEAAPGKFVRFSHLKKMALSPAHYRASLEEPKDTGPMAFGRLVHSMVLEGDFVVYDGERRGNAWKDFAAEHAGKDIYTIKEADRAKRIAEAVRNHPLAGMLLVGDRELHVQWETMGRACSSRLDVIGTGWLGNGRPFLSDLKTTVSSEPGKFSRDAIWRGYHAQAAWYQDAAAFIGRPVEDVFLTAVETEAPFAVTVLHLTPRLLEQGRKLCRLWLERLLACEAADEWPAYAQSIVDLDAAEDFALVIDEDDEAAA